MAISTSHLEIGELIGRVTRGEIRLPEIQRGYVWKPTQVAGLVDSLYHDYPSGSLLLWQTDAPPVTHGMQTGTVPSEPTTHPQYLLDGQQRLTSLHRVFSGHPDAQIVFNVETERFQNQSAATRQNPRWVSVHSLVSTSADLFATIDKLAVSVTPLSKQQAFSRVQRVQMISKYRYYLEILSDLSYEQVTEIFIRVNSRGRALRSTDLALATLSARWPGTVARLETEAQYWKAHGWGDLDLGFLTRALAAVLLGRGLSQWSLGKLNSSTDQGFEDSLKIVKRGLKDLVPLLGNNVGIRHSNILPSVLALIPLVVVLGSRADEPLNEDTANGLVYWFLAATLLGRYGGATDSVLGQDIPAAQASAPVRALLNNLGLGGAKLVVTPQALVGRGQGSAYFLLSFLAAQEAGAKDWWFSTKIDFGGQGMQKLQYHHVHPQATLKGQFSKQEINDLANLAFISAKANVKISDRSPVDYFPEIGNPQLAAHLVPTAENLRTSGSYPSFINERRRLLATAMTSFLDQFCPTWLTSNSPLPNFPVSDAVVDFSAFISEWDAGKLLISAAWSGRKWRGILDLDTFEAQILAAGEGTAGDIEICGQLAAIRPIEEVIEADIGPFVMFGSSAEWAALFDRERAASRPLSQAPVVLDRAWAEERMRFPVSSSE